MAAPYNNLRSKINRAIAAYLVSVGAGSVDDTLPHFTRKERPYPNTTIRATIGNPDPPLTGNYRVRTHISVKGGASQSVQEPNAAASRVAFDARLAAVYDAMMQSDDGLTLRATATLITAAGRALAVPFDTTDAAIQFAANNADMADFTVLGLFDAGFGDGEADDDGCAWEEILLFDVLACGSNVD